MSEPRQLPVIDDDPKDGKEVHLEDLELTEKEIADGEKMGRQIDIDDDEDNGGIA